MFTTFIFHRSRSLIKFVNIWFLRCEANNAWPFCVKGPKISYGCFCLPRTRLVVQSNCHLHSFYWSKWHKYIFWSPISAYSKLIFESKLLSTNLNEWVRGACHAAEVNSLSTEAFLFKTESSPGMKKCVLCHCHTTTQIQSCFYFNDQSNSMCENIYTFIFLHNVPVKRLRESPYFVNWEIFNLLSHWVAMVFSSVFWEWWWWKGILVLYKPSTPSQYTDVWGSSGLRAATWNFVDLGPWPITHLALSFIFWVWRWIHSLYLLFQLAPHKRRGGTIFFLYSPESAYNCTQLLYPFVNLKNFFSCLLYHSPSVLAMMTLMTFCPWNCRWTISLNVWEHGCYMAFSPVYWDVFDR